MIDSIKNFLQNRYQVIIHSIAFYPVLIGFLFILISAGLISLDYSTFGVNLKTNYQFLNIKDSETVRSILSAIAGGIISLTVFSFSMVMIVLNQAASNLSNRVLDNLIGNRRQQYILGIYIGTIVYTFFILTAIRDIESTRNIPSISTYFGILLTIFDIFLFIYFLHYITQSVKFDVIISRIYQETKKTLQLLREEDLQLNKFEFDNCNFVMKAHISGVFENYNTTKIIEFCKRENLKIELLEFNGTYLLKNSPVLKTSKRLTKKQTKELENYIFIVPRESIEENFSYGVRQLREIAVKALSPGINDPGTAIEALKAIFQLFQVYLEKNPARYLLTNNKQAILKEKVLPFELLFNNTIPTIWHYGKDDQSIQKELLSMIEQLNNIYSRKVLEDFKKCIT